MIFIIVRGQGGKVVYGERVTYQCERREPERERETERKKGG